MLIFALHVQTDRKLTVENKITRNLFLYQKVSTTKSQKEKILTLTKE